MTPAEALMLRDTLWADHVRRRRIRNYLWIAFGCIVQLGAVVLAWLL